MEEVKTPWCPCQEELFEEQYPARKRKDMAYLDGVNLLERVGTSEDLSVPYTRRGTKIIDENFPEASMVCPSCEQEFVEERIVRKKE